MELPAPLLGHRLCHTTVRPAPLTRAVRPRHPVNPSLSTFNAMRRVQRRQVLQPQARCLRLAVPELPRLDDLIRLAHARRNHTDRVLDGDAVDGRGHEQLHEPDRVLLLLALLLEPPSSADAEVRTGREGDHHVPAVVQEIAYVAQQVRLTAFARQDIAAHGIVASFTECVTDDTGELAGDEDLHCHEPELHLLQPSPCCAMTWPFSSRASSMSPCQGSTVFSIISPRISMSYTGRPLARKTLFTSCPYSWFIRLMSPWISRSLIFARRHAMWSSPTR